MMNFTNGRPPGFPPVDALRELASVVSERLDNDQLTDIADKVGDDVEFEDEPTNCFRAEIYNVSYDIADELWPAGNGATNSDLAKELADASAPLLWAKTKKALKWRTMKRGRAQNTFMALKQHHVNRMGRSEREGLEGMITWVASLLDMATAPKE